MSKLDVTGDELLAMLNGLVHMTESLGGALVLIRGDGTGEVFADLRGSAPTSEFQKLAAKVVEAFERCSDANLQKEAGRVANEKLQN